MKKIDSWNLTEAGKVIMTAEVNVSPEPFIIHPVMMMMALSMDVEEEV